MRKGEDYSRSVGLVSLLAVFFFFKLLLAAPAIYGAGGIWSGCKGPEGGGVNVLAIDPKSPQTIYAGTDNGGVFKSTDAGGSWNSVSTGLTNSYVKALAIDPTSPLTIYAGTNGGGVFKSTDGGGGWSTINKGLATLSVSTLAIDPTSPKTIYAGTNGGGAFSSTNGGSSWSAINSGLTNNAIRILVIDPTSPQTIYAGTNGGGVFKSTNGGGSWSAANAGLTDTAIGALAIDPLSPQTIYAGSDSGGVFKSTNGGGGWSTITAGLATSSVSILAIDPTSLQTIYIGTGGGVFKSTNGGSGWSAVNTGLPGTAMLTLVIDPASPQTVYAGSQEAGAFKSANGGISWSAANTGLTAARIYALAMDPTSPQTIYAGTYGGGAFKSTDGCASWNAINSGLATYVRVLAIDPKSPQTIYAGTYGGGVYKSTNAGESWSKINTGLTGSNISALAIDPMSPQTIYAGVLSKGVFKSTNGGSSWDAFTTGLTNNNVRALAIAPSSTQTIYAGTDAGVFKRLGGVEEIWNLTDLSLSGTSIWALAIDPTSPQTIYAGTRSAGMLKSTEGGSGWISINVGLGTSPVLALAIDPTFPQTIFAGTSGGGVSKSADGGSHWKGINTGLPSTVINALVMDATSPQTVYAGTYGVGAWVFIPPCSSVSANGVTKCETAGVAADARAGYAKLTVSSGATPYGTAVFGFKQNGITVTEAGVPVSPPTKSARLFIDYRKGVNAIPVRGDSGTIDVNTGIAGLNYGFLEANVTLTLRDQNGSAIAAGTAKLGAGNHFASFVDGLKANGVPDFNLPADFQSRIQFATLDISSDQPLSLLALRGTTNQRNEFLITTTPVADLTQSLGNGSIYFPQFVDGGGYTTSIILLNTSSVQETGKLDIRDKDGNPLIVNQVGGTRDSSFSYSIKPGGLFRFQTDGFPVNTKAGWVRLTPDAGLPAPVGSGVFGYNPNSVLVSESGIPATIATTRARVYIDLSRKHNTGLAIANVSSLGSNITIAAYQKDGLTPAGTSKPPIPLAANGYSAAFAGDFVTGLPAEFTGVLDISATLPFAALTLRSLTNERGDFLMTTFPVADVNQPAPSPIVFPQVADGGGYVTEFILISAGQASGTILSYYDDEGTHTDYSD